MKTTECYSLIKIQKLIKITVGPILHCPNTFKTVCSLTSWFCYVENTPT